MSKADRLEDLGKIFILLDQLTDDEIFDKFERPKYAEDVFFSGCDDKQHEDIRMVAYGIERIYTKLIDVLDISRGDEN